MGVFLYTFELFYYFLYCFLLRGITDNLRSFLPKLKKESKQLLCALSLADLTGGFID